MKKPYTECRKPWENMQVLANGDVRPCCWCTLAMGNLNEHNTIEEIWNGPASQRLRKNITEGVVDKMCKNAPCPYNTGESKVIPIIKVAT